MATDTRAAQRPRIAALLAILMLLVLAAIYVYTRPIARERELQRASLAQLEALAAHSSDDPLVLYYFALRLQAAGRADEAAKQFERAAGLSDDEQIFVTWASYSSYSQAIHILSYYLDRHPHAMACRLALARTYVRVHDYRRALEQSRLATAALPSNGEAWQLLGDSADGMVMSGDAEAAYRRAILLGRRNEALEIGLDGALMEEGKSQEAVERLKSAVMAFPTAAPLWLALGKALFQTAHSPADYRASADAVQHAVNLGLTSAPAYLYLGRDAIALGDWAGARTDLERASQLDPFEPQAPFFLAQVYSHTGALASARQAMTLHSKLVAYLDRKHQLIFLLRSSPGDNRLMRQIAKLALQNGDYQAANGYYQRLLPGAPGDKELRKEAEEAMRHAGEAH